MTIRHRKEKEQIRLGNLSHLEAKLVSFWESGFHFSLFGCKCFMLKLATPYREEAFCQFSSFLVLLLNFRDFMLTFSDFFWFSLFEWSTTLLNLMKIHIQPPDYVLFINFTLVKVMIQVNFRKFRICNKAYQKSNLNSTTLR